MPASLNHVFTTFPPYEDLESTPPPHDSPIQFAFDCDTGDTSKMASATSPYIKAEPNDFFDSNSYSQFNNNNNNGQNMNGQHMNNNINPASLSNSMAQNYSSFSGNAAIADDELLDLHFETGQPANNGNFDFNPGMQGFLQTQNNPALFSHTPDGGPIQSPFVHDFNYNQFRPVHEQQFAGTQSLPQQAGFRPNMQQLNGTRSPVTPTLKISDDFSHPGMQPIVHRQQNSVGNANWDSTPSGHSWEGSPSMSSPPNGPHSYHLQISEVLKNNNGYHKSGTSLPTKMEPGSAPSTVQEAKRRRRRESHNMVERRRRDNINERIHDLGTLVPQHRLEDEKVRKHLQTNAPLSPSITNSGISPPNPASSLLAGPSARRATGITQGFPMDDKDKGPNKGDILNGSVAWTRDMMWFMHHKLAQEEQLKQILQSVGKEWPFSVTEEETRMRSEICEVLGKHASQGGFTGYSRAPGSGLRVPGFTNVAGDSVSNGEGLGALPPIDPNFQSGSNGMNNGMSHNGPQFWSPHNDLKEEDEYDMDLQ